MGNSLKSRNGLVDNLFRYINLVASVKAWANTDRGTSVTAAVEKKGERGEKWATA